MRRLRPAVGIVLTATVLTGCAGSRPDATGGTPSLTAWAGTGTAGPTGNPPDTMYPVTSIPGSVEYTATAVEPTEPDRTYDGVYEAATDGSTVSVLAVVENGSIGLRAACGGTWGSGTWTGGVLSYQPYVEPPPQTAPYTDRLGVTQTPEPQPPEPTLEERCGAEIAGTMTAVQDVLSAGPAVEPNDTGLILAAPDGRNATLTAVTSADEPAITGRRWELATYRYTGADAVDVPPADGMVFSTPTLQLVGTELVGSSGCNYLGGTALADGRSLWLLSGMMTERGCTDDGAAVEQAIVDALRGGDRYSSAPVYSVTDGVLTVSTPDIELRYRDAGPARTTG